MRERIWAKLRDALPDTRFHLNFAEVIPDFRVSDTATDRVIEDFAYAGSSFAFITPDNCLSGLRRRMIEVIEADKPFVMSTYDPPSVTISRTPGKCSSIPAGRGRDRRGDRAEDDGLRLLHVAGLPR